MIGFTDRYSIPKAFKYVQIHSRDMAVSIQDVATKCEGVVFDRFKFGLKRQSIASVLKKRVIGGAIPKEKPFVFRWEQFVSFHRKAKISQRIPPA